MSQWTAAIAERLSRVGELRRQREAEPELTVWVDAVKRYQHRRFQRDYAALLDSSRYHVATRFFLDELYGPGDFSARDAEFERVVPWMARLLSDGVMRTVANLLELHALTEDLDQQMANVSRSANLDDRSYREAWREVGRRNDRARQLALLLAVGTDLDRHTGRKALVTTLRLMRRPAQAAGLGKLQSFLEAGLAAFAAMGGSSEFLRTIETNETRTINDLFGERIKPDR